MPLSATLILAGKMDFLKLQKPPKDRGRPGAGRDPRGLRRNPLVWIAVIGAIILYTQYGGGLPGSQEAAQRRIVQVADVGGPFELTDHTGRAVTDRDFLGRYMLVYFGYTWCPDTCPVDVLVMSQAVEMLGKVGDQVQPIFITVDPARDTVRSLADFVGHFHPRLLALTGSAAQIAAAAEAYKVYYGKGEEGESPDDYPVDHTTNMYLMGPDGVSLDLFRHGMRPAEIAQAIGQHL
jgi:protein SCO1/2